MSLDLNGAWKKSTRSAGNGNCVEVAVDDDNVAVRDSKNLDVTPLVFSRDSWVSFISAVNACTLAMIGPRTSGGGGSPSGWCMPSRYCFT